MISKSLLYVALGLLFTYNAQAQSASNDSLQKEVTQLKKDVSAIKRIKFSGYIQPQFQLADSAGAASVAGGNFAAGLNNRFMIRRGRLKAVYTSTENSKAISTSQFTMQIDVTERGMVIKEAFAKLTDPWKGVASVSMGMFNNPFGFEVGYSSALRETPEFGRMSQTLFPNEMEVGAMLTLQGPKKSKWNKYRLDAALVNGNNAPGYGVDVSDFDSKKDFVGRFSTDQSFKDGKLLIGAGLSYYSGGFRIDSVNVYSMGQSSIGINGFILDTKAADNGVVAISDRGFTERTYMGADLRLTVKWKAGSTTLRGEYITGQQPGLSTSSRSPNDKSPISKDIYNREFSGGYFYLIHALPKLPLEFVAKYDIYDPNTDVSGDEVGKVPGASDKTTNETGLKYTTLGFGLNWYYDQNIRLMAYYDMVTNETSTNLSGWTADKQDNVFTLRMQVKF
ncbi:MAG: porin [Bacteroidota bacterium]